MRRMLLALLRLSGTTVMSNFSKLGKLNVVVNYNFYNYNSIISKTNM